jgi:hypothetical protein
VTTFVGAGIDEESPEPGIEPIDVAKPWKLSPCMDECFLDGVLGPLSVPKDQAGDRIETVTRRGREDLEGIVIALSCRFHDRSLHQPLHGVHDRVAALSPYDASRLPTVQESAPERVGDRVGDRPRLRQDRGVAVLGRGWPASVELAGFVGSTG